MRGRGIELDTASSMKVVDAIQMAAEVYAADEGLDPEEAHFLGLALREAMVNSIKHGHDGDFTRRITVSLRVDSRRNLVFTVKDEGGGFNPDDVPDPLAEENLVSGSGRGVFYIRKFTDEVSFTFPKNGGTVVRMKKRIRRR
jgi:serine/threonine-protein kinase RsbW